MKKTIYFILLVLILSSTLVIAQSHEDFTKAEELIKSKVSCLQLTDEQLEMIGEYYMEQMHPGELHEMMDERMGGEGSESLKLVHINIAKSFYCGESKYLSAGMMNMMMGRNGFGMMNQYYRTNTQTNSYNSQYIIVQILFMASLIILIFILIKSILNKKIGVKNGKKR